MEPISATFKGSGSRTLLRMMMRLMLLSLAWHTDSPPREAAQPVLSRLTGNRRILRATITHQCRNWQGTLQNRKMTTSHSGNLYKTWFDGLERAHDLHQLPFTKDNPLRKVLTLP